MFLPPMSANVFEIPTRIIAAVAEVAPEMLRGLWQEIDYGWDVSALPVEVT
jgi:hypothetical protein